MNIKSSFADHQSFSNKITMFLCQFKLSTYKRINDQLFFVVSVVIQITTTNFINLTNFNNFLFFVKIRSNFWSFFFHFLRNEHLSLSIQILIFFSIIRIENQFLSKRITRIHYAIIDFIKANFESQTFVICHFFLHFFISFSISRFYRSFLFFVLFFVFINFFCNNYFQ